MKGFNLAKFKKIKEDKDWATLIHEDGHTINIAKAPLLPIQRKQVEALAMHEKNQFAEGGTADSSDQGQSESQPSELDSILADTHANAPQPATPAAIDTASVALPAVSPTSTPIQSMAQAQNAGYTQEQQGNMALAQAQGNEGTQQAKQYTNTLNDLDQLPSQQDIIASHSEKDKQLENAFAQQKIDPDHYFQNHPKVAATIGVLLGGLGQAIGAGQVKGNQALDVVQNGINRDIDAQKANAGQSLTLWQMNRQALGNDLAADLTTKNQLYTALQAKIARTAAASQKPIALAQAQVNNAKIQQMKDQNNFKLSLLNPTSDNPDPSSRIQFLVPQPEQQSKVAGVVDSAKNVVSNTPGILDAFFQSAKDSRPLTGGVNTSPAAFAPGIKTAGQQALQARLGPTFQDVEGTVRQAAMDNLDHNVTPKLGDSDEHVGTKLNSLIDYMSSKSAASLPKSFGIDLSKYPSTNATRPGIENYVRQNYPEYSKYLKSSQTQAPTKTVNGVTYTRGPNGQAIPVK